MDKYENMARSTCMNLSEGRIPRERHGPDKYEEVARWIVLTQVPFESASERDRKVAKIAQVLKDELTGVGFHKWQEVTNTDVAFDGGTFRVYECSKCGEAWEEENTRHLPAGPCPPKHGGWK